MTERIRSITRSTIADSDDQHGEWLPAYWFISKHLFDTEFSKLVDNDAVSERTDDIAWTADDFADMALYDDLMDATLGELAIPSALMDDQVEDWFVARAIRRGLEDQQRSEKLGFN